MLENKIVNFKKVAIAVIAAGALFTLGGGTFVNATELDSPVNGGF